jgi:hypothetical protein
VAKSLADITPPSTFVGQRVRRKAEVVAIPRALNPVAPASRLLWILVPVLGLVVAISCIRALLRMSARRWRGV